MRGFAACAIGPFSTVLIQIVSVPVFLHFWGPKAYGEWLILSAIPTYLSLSDIGFGNVAGNDMAMRVASGDREGALETFQSTWALVSLITLTIIIVSIAVFRFARVAAVFHLSAIPERDARIVLLLLGAEVMFTLQGNVAFSAFTCEGLFPVGALWWNVTRLTEYGLGTAAVCVGATPVAVALCFMIIRLLGTVLLALLLQSRIAWLSFDFRLASLRRIKQLFVPAMAMMGFPTGNAISIQGMVIVIGHLLNPIAVVVFSTLRTLTRCAVQIMNLINSTVWPELSLAYGAGSQVRARQLHRRACQLSIWLSLAAITTLAIFGPAIYRIWTHNKIQMNHQVFDILLLVVLANSFWFTSSVASVACNKHLRIAIVYVCGALLSVVLACMLIPVLGLTGAALALFAIEILMVGVVLKSSMRLLGDDLVGFARYAFSLPLMLGMVRTLLLPQSGESSSS